MSVEGRGAPRAATSAAGARAALKELFTALDAEDWDSVADHLDRDAELADELTGTWLRGRDAVARYLRAQDGIVTEIVSKPMDVAVRPLGWDAWLVTFNFDQRYLLMGEEHRERLTGLCVLRIIAGQWRLLAFHLGGIAHDATGMDGGVSDAEAEVPAPLPNGQLTEPSWTASTVSLGERLRRRRAELSFSLRAVAERAGVSASLLSQVERSLTDPSVGSLRRIAAALDVSVSSLVDDGDQARSSDIVLARARDRHRVDLGLWGLTVESFPSLPSTRLHAHIRHYSEAARGPTSDSTVTGDTLLYLLEGAVDLSAAGGAWSLEAGDAILMRASTNNDVRPQPGQTARVLVVQAFDR
ncbi:MAG: helix-turn-helix transcriptional regulator [Propionibacteriales bacterium]|nr:helix-turn-helix transcriptional regulator [Propionibacteriales bacterium]